MSLIFDIDDLYNSNGSRLLMRVLNDYVLLSKNNSILNEQNREYVVKLMLMLSQYLIRQNIKNGMNEK